LRYINIESPLSGRFIKPQRKWGRCRLRSQVILVITERSGISDLVRLLEHVYCRRVVTEESVILLLPLLALLMLISVRFVLRLSINSWS
jgi:hypothetical protein